ncbi:hypothetical protein PENTCL1PPCAC_14175, partial [Pristionchus entomophagus]
TTSLVYDFQRSMSRSTQQVQGMLVKVLNTQLFLAGGFFVGCICFVIDFAELPYLRNTSILSIPLSNLQNVCTPIANLFIITPYRRFESVSC